MSKISFKPDFFVVGFQKSATSTIHDILKKSNLISLPLVKETHFFSQKEIFDKSLSWYKNQFSFNENHKLIGEVDPSYAYFPTSVINIKKISDNPKFIFILRKPIDRAFSHYKMSVLRGYEERAFSEALILENSRLKKNSNFNKVNFSYLDRGNYVKQISRFQENFKDSEFLFLDFDDFDTSDKRINMILSLFDFLKLKIDDKTLNINFHSNKSKKVRFKFLQKLLFGKNFLRNFLSNLIKSKSFKYIIKKTIQKYNLIDDSNKNKSLEYSELSKEIIDWNNKEVLKLEKLLKLNLKKWIIPYNK